MRIFLISFAVALAVQLPLFLIFYVYGVGELVVYILYLLPYFLLPVSGQSCGSDDVVCFFALLSIPAVIYSAIIGLIIFGFSKILSRR